MMPQIYCNAPRQPVFMMGMPKNQDITSSGSVALLKVLAQALNKSLNNYQQKQMTSAPIPETNSAVMSPELEVRDNSEKNVEKLIAEESDKKIFKNSIEAQKLNIALRKTVSSEKAVEGLTHPTDDEIPSAESKQSSILVDVASKKKNKKERKAVKKDDFVVPVPEVDLIDHAYLPNQSMTTETLAGMKEHLMLRRVNNIGDFSKPIKAKREIRMLGN
jgi:hypothetical protein